MISLPSALAEIMGCNNSKHSRSADDKKKEAKKIIEETNSISVVDEKFIQNGQHHSSNVVNDLKIKPSSHFCSSLKEKLRIRHSLTLNSQPPPSKVEIIIQNQEDKAEESRKLTPVKAANSQRRKWSITRTRKVLTLHINPDQLKDEDIHELIKYFPFPGHHAEQMELLRKSPRSKTLQRSFLSCFSLHFHN